MTEGKVVNIYGQPFQDDREGNAEVIERLEELLERARAGDIVSIAMGYVHADGATSLGWAGNATAALLGALSRVTHQVQKTLDG